MCIYCCTLTFSFSQNQIFLSYTYYTKHPFPFFFPTRLEISIVYLFERERHNTIKRYNGGKKRRVIYIYHFDFLTLITLFVLKLCLSCTTLFVALNYDDQKPFKANFFLFCFAEHFKFCLIIILREIVKQTMDCN